MKNLAALSVCVFLHLCAAAQTLDWNIAFDYRFSNYEYARSGGMYDPSYTLHAARLTPEAGILLKQGGNVFHRVRAGVDLFRDMGAYSGVGELFGETVLYYDLEAAFRNGGVLEAVAGVFPRRFTRERDYIGPFLDDDRCFVDNNLEGMLFKYSNRRIYAELALDWPGKIGDELHPLRRERFQILSDGCWNFAGAFSLLWCGSLYHFSCAPQLANVVDNGMLHLGVSWSPDTCLDVFSLDARGLFTYQNDRHTGEGPLLPMGMTSRQRLGKWKLALENRFYFGDDLMPLYESGYGGVQYGADLYYADLAFHTRHASPSWADCLSVLYEPSLGRFLKLCVGLSFKFGEPPAASGIPVFRGWQQTFALRFDLDAMRPSPAAAGKKRFLFDGLKKYAF